jgi:hypothetical protein
MIRGTTPTHEFTIPFEVSLIDDLRISYAQSDKEILVKTKGDCTLEGNTITVTLSQEETFLFDCSKNVMLQVRVLTTSGNVLSSDIITLSVGRCINDEVL